MCFSQGGLSAMVVGTLICVGPPFFPRRPLRHSPPLPQVQLFPNSKTISHFSHFHLMSAQIPPPLLRFLPLSTFFPLPLIVDRPHSSTPYIASGIVAQHFLQINAIMLFPCGLPSGSDGTGREEYCFSFLQSSLNRKAQTLSHVAHHRNLAFKFLPRRPAFLQTLAGWRLCREKQIYCFIRGAHNHPAWKAVYHHHNPSPMSRLQCHNFRDGRILLASRTRYLTILLNSIASANVCRWHVDLSGRIGRSCYLRLM